MSAGTTVFELERPNAARNRIVAEVKLVRLTSAFRKNPGPAPAADEPELNRVPDRLMNAGVQRCYFRAAGALPRYAIITHPGFMLVTCPLRSLRKELPI
ncbi:MAG: hypothetical protein HKN07_08155 [Acidimicrobiia bacterium]|nr:hypothetical protein [Acidimicrobiia bacterium]